MSSIRLDSGIVVLTSIEGAPFGRRRLPTLPRGVQAGPTQLRAARDDLGAEWLAAIEALLRLIGGGAPSAPREPVAATSRS